jgi:hypothetical protein
MRHIDASQHYSDCQSGHAGSFEGIPVCGEMDYVRCSECHALIPVSPVCGAVVVIDLVEVLKARYPLHGRN